MRPETEDVSFDVFQSNADNSTLRPVCFGSLSSSLSIPEATRCAMRAPNELGRPTAAEACCHRISCRHVLEPAKIDAGGARISFERTVVNLAIQTKSMRQGWLER